MMPDVQMAIKWAAQNYWDMQECERAVRFFAEESKTVLCSSVPVCVRACVC